MVEEPKAALYRLVELPYLKPGVLFIGLVGYYDTIPERNDVLEHIFMG